MSNLTNYSNLIKALGDLFGSASETSLDVRRQQTKDALRRISLIETQMRLDPNTHPMLLHYLSRRSYKKALDFLESGFPESESTQC